MPHSVTPLFSVHEVQFLKKYIDGGWKNIGQQEDIVDVVFAGGQ